MTSASIGIRPMIQDDWPDIAAIYRLGIDSGDATFETTVPEQAEWNRHHDPRLSFVAVATDGSVVGWVAAGPVSDRCAYEGVVEHSVYVRPDVWGRGVGRRLLVALIEATEQLGIWTIESGVFPENQASLALHAACGFREVGVRRRVGKHHGRWRDVVWIERRSPNID